MNVFLDTNILFEDYFFENKSSKKILEYAEKGLINLYISNVVLLELKRQYKKALEAINKSQKDTSKLRLINPILSIDIEAQLAVFDKFYDELNRRGYIAVIDYRNDFLPEIINRAVDRIKPFTETRTELKDAVIWLTYARYVEENDIKDCFLLTNNVTDFCNKKDASCVHADLLSDTDRFVVINHAFAFVKTKAPIIESPEHKFKKYFETLEINRDFVRDIVIRHFESQVENEVHGTAERMYPSEILSNDSWPGDELVPYGIDIYECNEFEYEILGDRALISGKLQVSCEMEVLRYNSMRDPGEDSYVHIRDVNASFEVSFNFDLEENEIYSDFEVTDVAFIEVL